MTPHEFGNYVITNIIQYGTVKEKEFIIDEIIDDIVKHSLHKLGSNVVESCLKFAPDSRKDRILDQIVSVSIISQYDYSLVMMLDNEYANYVVQNAFLIADQTRREILYLKIERAAKEGHINRKKGFAKHVYAKIE